MRNGAADAPTPLTLAETASVFGEMLTFRELLDQAPTPARAEGAARLQGRGHDQHGGAADRLLHFERKVHTEQREGELTAERLGEIWLEVQRESLGPAIELKPGYETFWRYIPHFIHSPFYVYAYAFGDCLVNSLYAVYEKAEKGFAERISTCSRRRHQASQGAAGALRARCVRPEFWSDGAQGDRGPDRRARSHGQASIAKH